MNTGELCRAISDQTGVGITAVESVLRELPKQIARSLRKGGTARISGMGSFSQMRVAARNGRNPRNGDPIRIPAKRKARFRPAPSFSVQ